MKVTPSILVKDIHSFESQVKRLAPYYNHFQIDIVDGKLFQATPTIQLDDIVTYFSDTHKLLTDNLVFDFHLMVEDYEASLPRLLTLSSSIKIDTVLIHLSVLKDFEKLTALYPQFMYAPVLDPDDSVEALSKKCDLNALPGIQIMTVYPGAQGNAFLPNMLTKIEQLRTIHYRKLVYLDGAINLDTLPSIMSAKYLPDVIGPGSYFSHAIDEEIPERVKRLEEILKRPR